MNVIYSDRAKQGGMEYAFLQQASKQLEEAIGAPATTVTAEWDRVTDDRGHPLYTLRISDGADSAATSFYPDELASPYRRYRLTRLWGDVLQTKSHKQLQKLLGTRGTEG